MTNQPFTSVVFDFGGVLITPITDRIAEVALRHDVTMEQLLYVLMGPRETSTLDHPWHRAERGEIPVADFQQLVMPWAHEMGIDLTGDEYEIILDGVFSVHQPMVARIEQLRRDGLTTALLTNSFREFRDHLERHVDFDIFDFVIDSSEVGCRKPEPEIYWLTAERLGVKPESILYLDDFMANVVGAREVGWSAIHVTGVAQALAEMDELLVSRQ